jgi:hypothetical protein
MQQVTSFFKYIFRIFTTEEKAIALKKAKIEASKLKQLVTELRILQRNGNIVLNKLKNSPGNKEFNSKELKVIVNLIDNKMVLIRTQAAVVEVYAILLIRMRVIQPSLETALSEISD